MSPARRFARSDIRGRSQFTHPGFRCTHPGCRLRSFRLNLRSNECFADNPAFPKIEFPSRSEYLGAIEGKECKPNPARLAKSKRLAVQEQTSVSALAIVFMQHTRATVSFTNYWPLPAADRVQRYISKQFGLHRSLCGRRRKPPWAVWRVLERSLPSFSSYAAMSSLSDPRATISIRSAGHGFCSLAAALASAVSQVSQSS